MCYAKPGKRCYFHASLAFEASEATLASLKKKKAELGRDASYRKVVELNNNIVLATDRLGRARLEYNATDYGLESLEREMERLEANGDKVNSVSTQLYYARERSEWQTETYKTLNDLENDNSFGKKFALENALKFASVELEILKEQRKSIKIAGPNDNFNRNIKYINDLGIKDLTSYTKNTLKKLTKLNKSYENLSEYANKLLGDKKFISILES